MNGWQRLLVVEREVSVGPDGLDGLFAVPDEAIGVVLFAHGSGSSRLSVRNRYVAEKLREAGLATLLFDLITEKEADDRTNVFDVELLVGRLQAAAEWIVAQPEATNLPLGYFGASTGAAAALVAAARRPDLVRAIVCRGGRPDLAQNDLPIVSAPTLLIVGGNDELVGELNREALAALRCEKRLVVIPRATHLFQEAGALEQVAELAAEWFVMHLPSRNTDRHPQRPR